MKRVIVRTLCVSLLVATAAVTQTPTAALAATPAHYYLALGESLAASAQPNGDFQHGYAEQLYEKLRQQDPGLRLVKLGCGGETTTSMVYGTQNPDVASSCGPPSFYLRNYPHKTQLAEAVSFLKAHGEVRLAGHDRYRREGSPPRLRDRRQPPDHPGRASNRGRTRSADRRDELIRPESCDDLVRRWDPY